MAYSFDDADVPTRKETQYHEMLGSRGIWHKRWKAVTEHGPDDLADAHPDRLEELKALWLREAKANNVLPLNDMGPHETASGLA